MVKALVTLILGRIIVSRTSTVKAMGNTASSGAIQGVSVTDLELAVKNTSGEFKNAMTHLLEGLKKAHVERQDFIPDHLSDYLLVVVLLLMLVTLGVLIAHHIKMKAVVRSVQDELKKIRDEERGLRAKFTSANWARPMKPRNQLPEGEGF